MAQGERMTCRQTDKQPAEQTLSRAEMKAVPEQKKKKSRRWIMNKILNRYVFMIILVYYQITH